MTVLRRYWPAVLIPSLFLLFFFMFLYSAIRRDFIEEIRDHARFAAICTASAINPADVESVRSAEDASSETYTRLQRILVTFRKSSEDIRYTYIMRRSPAADAAPSDYLYVADQPPEDADHNGVIDDSEGSELPGTPYDASELPAMVAAWNEPTADATTNPDPPYPDVLSGYAPIRNAEGKTVAIVGADVTVGGIERRLFVSRMLVILAGVVLSILSAAIIFLYCGRHEAFVQVRRMNADLQLTNQRLEEAAKLRDELSHMIVHDMRNSLTVIAGCNSMMEVAGDCLPAPQREEAREMQTAIEETTQQIIRMLEDMLVLAKSEAGKLVPRLATIDVRPLIKDAVKHMEVIAKLGGVSVEVSVPAEPIEVSADPQLLSRTLDNLHSNAIKHSPPAGRVRLTAEAPAPAAGGKPCRARIRVADEGPGVAPEIQTRLFEKFVSGTAPVGATRPIGLGLAFCKMVAEAHGGRIFLEASAKGSVFVVEF